MHFPRHLRSGKNTATTTRLLNLFLACMDILASAVNRRSPGEVDHKTALWDVATDNGG